MRVCFVTSRLAQVSQIAVEGCSHGELDAIYGAVAEADARSGQKTDVLLLCGDFQAVRNDADLPCIAMPQKYWQLGTFHRYYSGASTAPLLTIVIGGNHEASNYMWELYHGGWLAPRIYYLGAAGSVLLDGLRITGASGIYKSFDYRRGHYERLPFDHSSMRSIYHVREYDVFRLAQLGLLGRSPDIFLSHDWPLSIERYGDTQALLQAKPFFAAEIARNELGSPPLAHLLSTLKPNYWFAAHLHVRFAALWKHDGQRTVLRGQGAAAVTSAPAPNGNAPVESNTDEIELDLDEVDEQAKAIDVAKQPDAAVDESVDLIEARATVNPDEIALSEDEDSAPLNGHIEATPSAAATRFLALDKCLPGRHFMHFLDVSAPKPSSGEPQLTFDPLWLAVTRAFHDSLPLTRDMARNIPFDDPARAHALVQRELEWVRTNVSERGECSISSVQRFAPTAPVHPPDQPARKLSPNDQRAFTEQRGLTSAAPAYRNPQTDAFCSMLGLVSKVSP